jgi:hypothetical protein
LHLQLRMLLAQMIGTFGVAPTWDNPDMSGTSDPTLSDNPSSCQRRSC